MSLVCLVSTESLELVSQVAVSHRVVLHSDLCPLQQQLVLLTTEPSPNLSLRFWQMCSPSKRQLTNWLLTSVPASLCCTVVVIAGHRETGLET